MTTATRPANRLVELNAILDKMPIEESRAKYPGLLNERAALIRQQQEEERLEAARIADRRAKNIAAAFTPNIDAFRKRAQAVAQSLDVDASALEKQLSVVKTLSDDYSALWREGTAAGVSVPRLSELSGIGDRRLERVQLAITLLSAGDE